MKLKEYLKESLILEAGGSFGEYLEDMICEAWNSKGKELGKYEKDVIKKGIDPKTFAQNIYNSLLKTKIIKTDLYKLGSIQTTQEWKELGFYTKEPNHTPKTDIISKDSKVKISVKEERGARLMSGGVNETIATLRAAIQESGNRDLEEFTKPIFEKILGNEQNKGLLTRGRIIGNTRDILKKVKLPEYETNPPEDENERIVWEMELTRKELNAVVEKIKEFPKAYRALLYEAITGTVKFGPDSPAVPNYIATIDMNGNCELYDINDYIDKFGNKYKIYTTYKSSSVKVNDIKTGARDSWVVMTISN